MKAIILVAIFAVAVYSQGWTNGVWNGTANCATNCSYCNSWGTGVASVCTQAVAGQTFSTAIGACTACPSNCAQCNGTTCVTCNSGYAVVSGACVACSGTGAATCSLAASNTTSCNPATAYFLSSGACVTGTSLQSYGYTGTGSSGTGHVLTVGTAGSAGACTTADGNNLGLCVAYTACASGSFIFSSTGACTTSTTVANALYYTATGAAAACAVGYYPSAITTGAPTICTVNPTLTTTLANTIQTTGYIPWCQVYNTGSGSAVSAIICVACQQGFQLNTAGTPASSTAGQFCVPCSSTFSAACPFVGTWAGYYFNSTTAIGTWAACPSNVATCMYSSSGVVPTSCSTGYYLQQQLGGVLACVATTVTSLGDAKGLTFYNTSFAASCVSGYYSAGPTISVCVGCATCFGSVSNCSSCASGSTLSTTYTCSNGSSSNTSKGSNVIFSGLAFFSAILYYFL